MDSLTFFQVVANSLLARKCFLKNPTLALKKKKPVSLVKTLCSLQCMVTPKGMSIILGPDETIISAMNNVRDIISKLQ